jgi:hypothetical protein
MVPETSVSSFNQLTRLCAREDFIECSRCESFKLYTDLTTLKSLVTNYETFHNTILFTHLLLSLSWVQVVATP